VAGQLGGADPLGRRTGHAERGYRGDWPSVPVGDVPLDQVYLADVRERQILRRGSTWMVRVVIRPWPRSVAECATGTSRQGFTSTGVVYGVSDHS
jgi:hypothetical protein